MTTLAASIDALQRTIRLSGDVSTATPGRIYCIEDEVIVLERFVEIPPLVGGPTPGTDRTSWFIQRGSQGTDPVAHAAGVGVYGVRPSFARASGTGLPSPINATSVSNGETIPVGVIVMWGGLLSAIPTNWHLCDGTTGTADLRGLFIKGAAVGQNPGASGGSATHTHTTTQAADHAALTHSGAAVAAHAFTQPGAHTDHAALAHSVHAGATVANHVVTQPTGHSAHAFTQPGAHTFTQPAGHAAHAFTQPTGHSNHVFTQPANHVVTQPSAHADNIAHTHVLSMQGGTTAATTGTHIMNSTATGGSVRAIAAGDAVASQGTGASLTHTGTAVDAHSSGAVDAHSAHSGGAVDAHSAHSGGAVDAHAGGAVDAHSAHSGAAVDAHTVGQASAHSDHAALSHSAHSGGAVDAHGVTQASAHTIGSHSGAAVDVVNSEPAYYALAYIQKVA